MSTKGKNITSYHVKADEKILSAAQKLVDLPSAFRNLIEKITKTHKCPTCGHHLKVK